MSLTPIIQLLTRQGELQEELLALSYEKRRAIIESDTARLNDIVQQELQGLHQLNGLEKKRIEIIGQLAAANGMGEGEVTVSRLVQLAQGEEQALLVSLAERLGHMLAEQKKLNQLNRELLEVHIRHTDHMLDLLVGPQDPLNHIYGAGGYAQQEERKSAGFFDTQI